MSSSPGVSAPGTEPRSGSNDSVLLDIFTVLSARPAVREWYVKTTRAIGYHSVAFLQRFWVAKVSSWLQPWQETSQVLIGNTGVAVLLQTDENRLVL
jgi:hypothetical protein